MRSYTQADAHIDAKIGGAFSMFNGAVTGTIKELVPGALIVQAWRFKEWPDGRRACACTIPPSPQVMLVVGGQWLIPPLTLISVWGIVLCLLWWAHVRTLGTAALQATTQRCG